MPFVTPLKKKIKISSPLDNRDHTKGNFCTCANNQNLNSTGDYQQLTEDFGFFKKTIPKKTHTTLQHRKQKITFFFPPLSSQTPSYGSSMSEVSYHLSASGGKDSQKPLYRPRSQLKFPAPRSTPTPPN